MKKGAGLKDKLNDLLSEGQDLVEELRGEVQVKARNIANEAKEKMDGTTATPKPSAQNSTKG